MRKPKQATLGHTPLWPGVGGGSPISTFFEAKALKRKPQIYVVVECSK
jgi:hypothetical protein